MSKRVLVALTALVVVVAFVGGAILYERYGKASVLAIARVAETLVRPHSPVVGPAQAPVTIVEFLDPSCEACRAFHPIVKQIMAAFPNEVRLVIRYTPFHEGSDVAVGILEAARGQEKFVPVLEALLANQPEWAVHGAPDLDKAWGFAAAAGLDVQLGKAMASSPDFRSLLEQEVADVKVNNVRQTPTFFVNGRPLTEFGPQRLADLVLSEVERVRKGM
jgi:protein-disulfide isomerase